MQKYILPAGDLGNGFYLNRDLEGTMRLLHGGSMGAGVLYTVWIGRRGFEGRCSLDDDTAKRNLKYCITNKYQYLEEVKSMGRLSPEEEALRRELSDLLTKTDEEGEK